MHRFWGALFGAVLLACLLSFVVAPFVGWWMPRDVSTYGTGIDILFYVILAVTTFFFVLTEVILVYCLFKFPAVAGKKSSYTHGNHTLEMIWTVVPAVLLLILAFAQISVWADVKFLRSMPMPNGETQQIEVIAKQWEWRLRYPSLARMESWEKDPKLALDFGMNAHQDDVRITNELHVWKEQKVLVHLKTYDVIHSFFLPNFRLKQDALPGRVIPVWFAAREDNTELQESGGQKRWVETGYDPVTGEIKYADKIWELTCAEFCGARHSMMRGKLYVHKDRDDFKAWLKHTEEEQRRTSPAPTTNVAAR